MGRKGVRACQYPDVELQAGIISVEFLQIDSPLVHVASRIGGDRYAPVSGIVLCDCVQSITETEVGKPKIAALLR